MYQLIKINDGECKFFPIGKYKRSLQSSIHVIVSYERCLVRATILDPGYECPLLVCGRGAPPPRFSLFDRQHPALLIHCRVQAHLVSRLGPDLRRDYQELWAQELIGGRPLRPSFSRLQPRLLALRTGTPPNPPPPPGLREHQRRGVRGPGRPRKRPGSA